MSIWIRERSLRWNLVFLVSYSRSLECAILGLGLSWSENQYHERNTQREGGTEKPYNITMNNNCKLTFTEKGHFWTVFDIKTSLTPAHQSVKVWLEIYCVLNIVYAHYCLLCIIVVAPLLSKENSRGETYYIVIFYNRYVYVYF